MSIKVMTLVWEHSQAQQGDLLVLLYIADCANHDGTGAWPSVERIARHVRLEARSVQRSLRKLEVLGELSTEPNAGPYGANSYTVNIKKLLGQRSILEPVTPTSPRQNVTPDIYDTKGVTSTSPKPSLDPSSTKKGTKRVPASWSLSAKDKDRFLNEGLTEEEIAFEVEALRDHQFRDAHRDWDAVARNWLREVIRRKPKHRTFLPADSPSAKLPKEPPADPEERLHWLLNIDPNEHRQYLGSDGTKLWAKERDACLAAMKARA